MTRIALFAGPNVSTVISSTSISTRDAQQTVVTKGCVSKQLAFSTLDFFSFGIPVFRASGWVKQSYIFKMAIVTKEEAVATFQLLDYPTFMFVFEKILNDCNIDLVCLGS